MRRIAFVALSCVVGALIGTAPARAQTVYPKRTTIWRTGTEDGLTLFVGGDGIVYLIDMDGSVENTWQSPYPNEVLDSVEALAGGNILVFSGPPFPNPKTKALELDYDGNIVWEYDVPAQAPAGTDFHHDSARLPDGNTLILGSRTVNAPQISPLPLVDDYIVEVTPAGQVVWEWNTWTHFAQFGFDSDAQALIAAKGGDWAHANSINPLPANDHTDPALAEGNILVSQRSTNTFFIIDKQTKDIVWKIGPEPHLTFGQHDPHMIPQGLPGAGNILVFDNGAGVGYPLEVQAPGFSSVYEVDPVTQTPVWTYQASDSGLSNFSFFANIVSGSQRLSNGNTLICSGAKGRLFEVSPTGDLLWEYMSPYANSGGFSESRVVFRAYRLPYRWHTTALSRWVPVEQLPGGPSLVGSGIPGTALKTK